MDLGEYQRLAARTDQVPSGDNAILLPLLGMAGEVGTLLVEYKKWLRDKDAHVMFPEHMSEELGDVLWYLADVATKFDLDLDAIAAANLRKTQDRWPPNGHTQAYELFDTGFPETEQLPRRFEAEITEAIGPAGKPRMTLLINGEQAGDALQDNSYADDGYRFHDVIHLAHVAMLGWSPVVRGRFLRPNRKRKSRAETDEVEDGGRAVVIEEAIVAHVWEYARRHRFLDGIETIDYRVLKTVKQLSEGLEVSARTPSHWEETILAGYRVWRAVRSAGKGRMSIDMTTRTIALIP